MLLLTIPPTHVIVVLNYGGESTIVRYGIPRNVVKSCNFLICICNKRSRFGPFLPQLKLCVTILFNRCRKAPKREVHHLKLG